MSPPDKDPRPLTRSSHRGHLRGWLFNLILFLLVLGALQWWKTRPLASGPAPSLAGITLEGRALDLRDLRGQPVLVHFWATWCPVCRIMDGAIEGIAGDHPVISVAFQSGAPQEIQDFMRKAGLTFPVLADPDGRIATRWGVSGVPATFVVDAQGRISDATVGVSTGPGLRARLWIATLGMTSL